MGHLNIVSYLIKINHRLPEMVLHLVKVPHAHLSKVSWVILVEVGTVMMLTTGHTTTTWVFSVLANTSMTGGDVSATV